jgi:hypothetical protein
VDARSSADAVDSVLLDPYGNAADVTRERWGRTLEWDAKLEAAVSVLTPAQVSAVD